MKKKILEAICVVCGAAFVAGFIFSNIGWFSFVELMSKTDATNFDKHNAQLLILMSSTLVVVAFAITLTIAALPLFLKDNHGGQPVDVKEG